MLIPAIGGIVLLASAVFAEQLGIDNDPGWGNGRRMLCGAGIALLLAALLSFKVGRGPRKPTGILVDRSGRLDESTRIKLFSGLAGLIVLAVYAWFFWPFLTRPTTNYYSQLALAFQSGQLHLLEVPPPSLLALSDPYDYESRRAIEADFPWDVSLYGDKFYLYWGPVPAILLTLFGSGQLPRIGDQYVFFVFICGFVIYSLLFIQAFWDGFDRRMPAWMICISLLAIGLSGPAIWMLTRARIYEAAVIGGQFFFIGGCYWAYRALCDSPPGPWKFALAGLHWGLAAGTRITVLPAVLFLLVLTLFFVRQKTRDAASRSLPAAALAAGLPVAVVLGSLGLYNWLRFGSIFESGFHYQLASVNYREFVALFSIDYIENNLFNYFLHPVDIQAKFPYLRAVENVFSNARLAGLLYTTPSFLFVGIPLVTLLYSRVRPGAAAAVCRERKPPVRWLLVGLAGSTLASLVLILAYYYPAARFAGDFMPAALLLAVLGLGWGYDLLGRRQVLSRIYLLLAAGLVVCSAVVSMLVAVPIGRTRSMLLLIKLVQQWLGMR